MILPTATFTTLSTSILAVITSARPAVGYDIHSLVARVDALTAKVDEQSNKIAHLLKQKTDPQVLGNKKLRGLVVSPTSWTYDKGTINDSLEDLQSFLNAIANCVTYDDSSATPVCKVGSPAVDVFVPGSLTAEGDISGNSLEAENGITATGGNIVADVGFIEATNGDISGNEVKGSMGITATGGNIVAQMGFIQADKDVSAGGNVTAGDQIIAQNDITSTSGNIIAQAGNVTAAMEVFTDIIDPETILTVEGDLALDP